MLIPCELRKIEIGVPLPFNLFDPDGVLLLSRGQVIRDQEHLQRVEARAPMVDDEAWSLWAFHPTPASVRKFNGNASLDVVIADARPSGTETQRELTLAESWADLHSSLSLLLHQGAQAQNFLDRLEQIEGRIENTLGARVDDSLLVLVQMLLNRELGYSTSHALLCTLLCRLVGQPLLPDAAHLQSLVRAALTMNIGMTQLQDRLALRRAAIDAELRAAIEQHPAQGLRILQGLGVNDALWLYLVRVHHQALPVLTELQSTPPGLLMAHLLSMADVFVARISPRASRKGLPAQQAARNAYLMANGQPSPLGAAFIKTVGVYVPGSYVKLANGEVAVVARRQRRANEPLVFSLVGPDGMPLGEPPLRDTSDPAYQVKAGVAADEVRVRVSPAKLLARL